MGGASPRRPPAAPRLLGKAHRTLTPGRLVAHVALAVSALLATTACSATDATDGTDSTTPRGSAPATAARMTAAALPPVRVGSRVQVAVSVATMWASPSSPRLVDAPALRNPVDIRGWLAAMSTPVRRALVGRVETQALLGETLLVTGISGGWLHVVAPAQPSHKDRRGYPGWVPARQVTTRAANVTPTVATVVTSKAWLSRAGRPFLEVSFGTRLPVVARTSTTVTVVLPTGAWAVAGATTVVVHAPTMPARGGGAAGVIATGKRFLRVPYLWGGRSGFAVDCSGFTELVYAAHGVVLPRDTDDQVRTGRAVARSALQPADLVFFTRGGTIGHVGFYAGSGLLLQAPATGDVVKLSPLSSVPGYAAARRYL